MNYHKSKDGSERESTSQNKVLQGWVQLWVCTLENSLWLIRWLLFPEAVSGLRNYLLFKVLKRLFTQTAKYIFTNMLHILTLTCWVMYDSRQCLFLLLRYMAVDMLIDTE